MLSRRERAKQLISAFHRQLTRGCGASSCANEHCASNPTVGPRSPNAAVLVAVNLVSTPDPYSLLCAAIRREFFAIESAPASAAAGAGASSIAGASNTTNASATSRGREVHSPKLARSWGNLHASSTQFDISDASPESEGAVVRAAVLSRDDQAGATSALGLPSLTRLYEQCARSSDFAPLVRLLDEAFSSLDSLRDLFGTGAESDERDVQGIMSAYDMLQRRDELVDVLIRATGRASHALALAASTMNGAHELRGLLVLLFNPLLLQPECSTSFCHLCGAVGSLSEAMRAELRRLLEHLGASAFRTLVNTAQSFLTMRILSLAGTVDVHEDAAVVHSVVLLDLYHAVNERSHAVSAREFYNDALNDLETLDLHREYTDWLAGRFAFCDHAYLLDSATKYEVLFLESQVQMHLESRNALWQTLLMGPSALYLVLQVHRDSIVRDTLNQLALHPDDLKKQMKVQFVGEDGVDEGGVRKEFFQIIVRQLFDEAFGMFVRDDEAHTYYFNPASLEEVAEFKLCGMILGLAIYNSTILDMHFPKAVYKLLCNAKPGLDDLANAKPAMGRSLRFLLDEFTGDFASLELFFVYEYEAFGRVVSSPLKPGGADIAVTRDNLAEYIELLVQHVLVDLVRAQFAAFQSGFLEVCGSRALGLFSPDELELMICGSPDLDLHALEAVTEYESGFTASSPTVRHFWEIVHELPMELKRKLLAFSTGSDRVPIKGLQSLKFIVMRAGPDSDRLPTSHTCFNHLLLPDYANKDKLRRLLLAALMNAEGFGMF